MEILKSITLIAILAAVTIFSSCGGGGDEPSVSIDEKLSGSWSLSSVTRDGVNVDSEFSGFSISFSSNGPNSGNGSYSASHGGNLLVAGNYTLSGTTSLTFTENSGLNTFSAVMELSNDDKTLTVSFFNPNDVFGGGRIEGASGDYVFVLNK